MPLPVFDTQDAIPEAFRSEYELKDGKYHPKAQAADPALGDAGKAALEKERTARKAEKERADAAERERDDLKRAAEAAAKGISATELQKIKDDEAKARKPLEDENAKLKAENRKLQHQDKVSALALKAGILEKRLPKAMLELMIRTDLADDNKTIVVKDAAGNVTSESIEDFLSKTYKTEAAFYYNGADAGGSGADADLGGGGGSAYDPVAAGKAAAAAQKAGRDQNALAFK
jgi:hypothetical protein